MANQNMFPVDSCKLENSELPVQTPCCGGTSGISCQAVKANTKKKKKTSVFERRDCVSFYSSLYAVFFIWIFLLNAHLEYTIFLENQNAVVSLCIKCIVKPKHHAILVDYYLVCEQFMDSTARSFHGCSFFHVLLCFCEQCTNRTTDCACEPTHLFTNSTTAFANNSWLEWHVMFCLWRVKEQCRTLFFFFFTFTFWTIKVWLSFMNSSWTAGQILFVNNTTSF